MRRYIVWTLTLIDIKGAFFLAQFVVSVGKFSEKTVWRWSKAIRDELRDSSSELWRVILKKLPHVEDTNGRWRSVFLFRIIAISTGYWIGWRNSLQLP